MRHIVGMNEEDYILIDEKIIAGVPTKIWFPKAEFEKRLVKGSTAQRYTGRLCNGVWKHRHLIMKAK